MGRKSNILPNVLPRDSLQLGWLVLDPNEPLQGYHAPSLPHPPDVRVTINDLLHTSSKEKTSMFRVSLGYIMRSGYLKNDGVSIDLSAATASLRTLPNSDGWFEEICASVHTRKWLEQNIERIGLLRLRVYLIVGLHTFQGVKFVSTKKGDVDVRVADDAKAPLTALVMAGSQMAGVMDPGLSSTFDNARQIQRSFTKDDLIYSVQYRQLKFNWLSSKDLDKSYLHRKAFWKVMLTD